MEVFMKNAIVLKIAKIAAPISLVAIGIMALIFKNPKPIILGFVFGTLVSILSLALISDSTTKILSMRSSKAKVHTSIGYFTRLLIYSIVLVISYKAEYLNIFSAYMGLNMVKITIFIMAFLKVKF
jgi:hypothetical protein